MEAEFISSIEAQNFCGGFDGNGRLVVENGGFWC